MLASCAVIPPSQVNEDYRAVIEQRHHHYQIKPGDVITVKLFNRGEAGLDQTDTRVLPDGRSDLYFMDNHLFAGKTLEQVEAEMRDRIAQQVLDTEISIQVTPSGEKVHMVGQFERPGTYDLTLKMTLQEAISVAGGLRVTGDTDWALLRRPLRNPAHPDQFRIDLNDQSEDIVLLPGDQILLGRNFLAGVINYLHEYLFSLLIGSSPAAYAAFAAL